MMNTYNLQFCSTVTSLIPGLDLVLTTRLLNVIKTKLNVLLR